MVNTIFVYSEVSLVKQLSTVGKQSMLAFATACATRQSDNFLKFATPHFQWDVLTNILTELWAAILGNATDDPKIWKRHIDTIDNFLPSDDHVWTVADAIVDDAISSTAYALRCFISGEAQEAAWSARRSYESADQIAIKLLNAEPGQKGFEKLVSQHEIVQRELQRQNRDMQLLRLGKIQSVHEAAFNEKPLTDEEYALLKLTMH